MPAADMNDLQWGLQPARTKSMLTGLLHLCHISRRLPGSAMSFGWITTHFPPWSGWKRLKSSPSLFGPSKRTLPMMVSAWFLFNHSAICLSSRLPEPSHAVFEDLPAGVRVDGLQFEARMIHFLIAVS